MVRAMNRNNERGSFTGIDVVLCLLMLFLLFGISLLIASS
jgi:hypothetical protein